MLAIAQSSGKGEASSALRAAKEHLWKQLMHMWCTYVWLIDRVDQIQRMWDTADVFSKSDALF